MSQPGQPPVALASAPTPPPEGPPPPLDAAGSVAHESLTGSATAGAGLVAITGGLLTPGGTPSLADIDTSPLAAVSPLAATSSASTAAADAVAPASLATAGPSVAKPATPVPTQSSEAAILDAYLGEMTALGSHLRSAEQANEGRAMRSLLGRMQATAYQAWLDHVYSFDAPTDSYYFLILVLLRVTTGDLPVALHLLNSAKPSLKSHPLALPLASLVSAVNEGMRIVVWDSVRRLQQLLTATPTQSTQDAAFRPVFSTVLEIFYGDYQESAITLLSETYASLPSADFAAYLDLSPSEVPQAVRNLGWKMDEAAGLVLPVKRQAEPGQAFGSAHFDRLARRVLALEEAIRVD